MAFAARSQSRSGGVGVETWTPCTGVQYSVQCTVHRTGFVPSRSCLQTEEGSPAPGLGPTGGLALHSGSPGTRGAGSSLSSSISSSISTLNHLHLNNLQCFSQIYIHIHAQIWAAHTMNMAWKDLNPFKKPDMTAAGSSFRFDLFLSPQSHKEPSKKILLVFACSVSVQYSVVYYSRSVVRACLVCIHTIQYIVNSSQAGPGWWRTRAGSPHRPELIVGTSCGPPAPAPPPPPATAWSQLWCHHFLKYGTLPISSASQCCLVLPSDN